MAKTGYSSLGPGLSTAEQVAGFSYLPVYVVFLSWGLNALSQWLGLRLTDIQLNLCYFAVNFLAICLIFHRFLWRSFRAIRFWELVQALILGFVLYYAGNLLLSRLLALLGAQVVAYNDDTIRDLVHQNRPMMMVCSLLIAPVVEETLVRGLMFGTLRRKNRWLAYGVSVVFFALIHVWKYLLTADAGSVLLSAIPYIPAGIALAWTYEKAGTVWASILLHALINAMAFGLMPPM